MMPLTPCAEIDELRRLTIAVQDHRIGWLTAEVAPLRGAAAALAVIDSLPKQISSGIA